MSGCRKLAALVLLFFAGSSDIPGAVAERSLLSEPEMVGPHRWTSGGPVGHVRELLFSDGSIRFMKTVSLDPLVLQVDGFLNATECDSLIAEAEQQQTDSSIKDHEVMRRLGMERRQYRLSRTAWVLQRTAIFKALSGRVAELTKMPKHVVEESGPVQVVFYNPDGHYKAHHDSLNVGRAADLRRYLTLLYVLEEADEGGGTAFPLAGVQDLAWVDHFLDHPTGFLGDQCSGLVLKPSRGSALLWYNHHVDFSVDSAGLGMADVKTLHAGCRVVAGRRVVANNWLRLSRRHEGDSATSDASSTFSQHMPTVGAPEAPCCDLQQLRYAIAYTPGIDPSRYLVSFGAGSADIFSLNARSQILRAFFVESGMETGLVVEEHDADWLLQRILGGTSWSQVMFRWAPFLKSLFHPAVVVRTQKVSPLNVVELLQDAGAPVDADVLRVELMSWDCALTYAILKGGYRPKFLVLTVNSEIPSAICFGVLHAEKFIVTDGNYGFYGCSSGLAVNLAKPFGYQIIGVMPHCTLVLARSDLLVHGGALKVVDEDVVNLMLARCGSRHLGILGSFEEWNSHANAPKKMLRLVETALQLACNISQDPLQHVSPAALRKATCSIPYTVSLCSGNVTHQMDKLLWSDATADPARLEL